MSSYTIGSTTTIATGIVLSATTAVVNYGGIHAVTGERSLSGDYQGGTGVQFDAGGSITNALGGTITGGTGIGGSNAAVTVVNAGRIGDVSVFGLDEWDGTNEGVSLKAGGLISNAASGGIYGGYDGVYVAGGAATVVNAGRIEGEGLYGDGVLIESGGSIDNLAGGVISADEGRFFGNGIGAFNKSATIVNAGTIRVQGFAAAVDLFAGGSVTNLAGGLITGSTGVVGNGDASTFVNAGTIDGTYAGIDLGNGGSVTNQSGGVISASSSSDPLAVVFARGYDARLVADPGAVFNGTLAGGGNYVGATAVSTLELAAGAAPSGSLSALGAPFYGFNAIAFDPGAHWFIAGDTSDLAGSISGFAAGDTIEVTGITVTGSSYTDGVLTLDEVSGSTTMRISGDFGTGDFLVTNVSGGADISVECFCAGTRILTPEGEVAVEDLRIGGQVETAGGEGAAAIIWVGRRTIDCTRHPAPEQVWPVRISAGAWAQGVPRRDLFLSPNHAVYANEVLIPVKHLINGGSIAQVPVDEVSYYHVELAQHAVMWAEGLPAESYLDVGDRANFANAGGTIRLFPDFSGHACDVALFWDAYGFAPLVVTGPALETVRRQVKMRAAVLKRRKAVVRSVA